MGKTKQRIADAVKHEYLPPPVQCEPTMFADICFVLEIPFFVSVTHSLGLTLVNHLSVS